MKWFGKEDMNQWVEWGWVVVFDFFRSRGDRDMTIFSKG